MRILVIGGGGREHAIAAALRRSPKLTRLTCAPGNAGIAALADLAALDPADHAAVIAFCKAEMVDFVVIGPEAPLVAGLVDDLEAAGIKAFGPKKEPARLAAVPPPREIHPLPPPAFVIRHLDAARRQLRQAGVEVGRREAGRQ